MYSHIICKYLQFCFFLSKPFPLIPFSHLIGLSRTSRTMLMRKTIECILVSFLILKGKLSKFPIYCDICFRFLTNNPYQIKDVPFYSWFAKSFLKNTMIGCCVLANAFTASIEMFI